MARGLINYEAAIYLWTIKALLPEYEILIGKFYLNYIILRHVTSKQFSTDMEEDQIQGNRY